MTGIVERALIRVNITLAKAVVRTAGKKLRVSQEEIDEQVTRLSDIGKKPS